MTINEIKDILKLYESLTHIVRGESLAVWFDTPNKQFNWSTPIEIIERGEIDKIWNMVFLLESGYPS